MADKAKKIVINFDVAIMYGTDAAIFIEHLRGWIQYNKDHGYNYKDGKTWMYNTVCRKKFNNNYEAVGDRKVLSLEEALPFWTSNQIRYIVEKLIAQNVIVTTDKYNKFKNDRKLWYAFVNEEDWFNLNLHLEADEEDNQGIGLGNFRVQTNEDLFSPQKDAINDVSESSTGKIPTPNEVSTENIPSPTGNFPNSELGKFRAHKKETNKQTNEVVVVINDGNNSNSSSEQYQIISKLLNTDVIAVVNDGGADALAFNFNDTDEVEKQIRRQFRMFVKDSEPHWTSVDKIKFELLSDIRNELNRKVSWLIILKAFMQFPGLNKEKQNLNYLLGMIQGMKNDFVASLEKEKKKKDLFEANSDRLNSAEQKKKDDEEFIEKELLRIKSMIEDYTDNLTHAEIRIVNDLLEQRKYIQAGKELRGILYNKNIQIADVA